MCYYLFAYCEYLVEIQELQLPATVLAKSCYEGMFRDCVNIEVAPYLPAKDLAIDCYEYMFGGCKKLNYI